MELADRGDPRLEHLAKDELSVLEVVGRVPFGEAIHLRPPLPEIAATRLDLAAQQALKGVAVHVGQARDGPAPQRDRVRRRGRALLDRRDAAVVDLDQHVLGAMAQPRLLGVPAPRAFHSSSMGMWTPRSRATSTARS